MSCCCRRHSCCCDNCCYCCQFMHCTCNLPQIGTSQHLPACTQNVDTLCVVLHRQYGFLLLPPTHCLLFLHLWVNPRAIMQRRGADIFPACYISGKTLSVAFSSATVLLLLCCAAAAVLTCTAGAAACRAACCALPPPAASCRHCPPPAASDRRVGVQLDDLRLLNR